MKILIIVTFQGANGGLGIMDGYHIDRNILRDQDIIAILWALRGLETSANNKTLHIIEKSGHTSRNMTLCRHIDTWIINYQEVITMSEQFC